MVLYPLISCRTYSDMKILLLLCFVVGALAENEACGENETFKSCGTACPLKCDNLKNPPKVCNLMCVAGCHCNEGYVRAHDGKCVLPENCPANEVCGENESYESCGTACPLKCDNLKNPPKICNMMCVAGCHCTKGYVRADDGKCVLPENCPSSDNLCSLPPKTGRCRGYFPRYHFDPATGKCKKFIYGGCGGNKNRFKTEEKCLQSCQVQQALDRPDCDKGADIGACRGRFQRFYYDQEAGMCKPFIYGGCGGNRNNFETAFDCYNQCGALHSVSACDQQKVVGPCKAAVQRYFYNKQTGECEEFIYGGCRGNANNFQSKDDCHATCA